MLHVTQLKICYLKSRKTVQSYLRELDYLCLSRYSDILCVSQLFDPACKFHLQDSCLLFTNKLFTSRVWLDYAILCSIRFLQLFFILLSDISNQYLISLPAEKMTMFSGDIDREIGLEWVWNGTWTWSRQKE